MLLPIIMHILEYAEEELHLKEFSAWLSAPTISHLKMCVIAQLVRAKTESLAIVPQSVQLMPEWLFCALQTVGDLLLKIHWPCSHAYSWIWIPQVSVRST